jgi:hypothetical protein
MTRPFARIVPFAAALLVGIACGSAEDRNSGPSREAAASPAAGGPAAEVSGSRLERNGVSIELPEGWRGRVLAPGLLQAANFDVAPVGQELPPGDEDPIKAMTAKHALVMILPCGLVSFEEPPRPAPSYLSLHDLTFLAPRHPRVPVGHAFAHGSFDFSGRCLRVEADFGGAPPATKLKDAVNAILASLSVAEN